VFAIEAENLTKAFKGAPALQSVSVEVCGGTVCGLLGRNGAGKTTLLRILTTLLSPDSGRARVAGFDIAREPARVRARIGVTGQSATMDELLTGRKNLEIIGGLYHLPYPAARSRAGDLLEQFGLAEAGNRLVRTYSGGMRRRLDLAASLVVSPPVLFLDEPTTGLDPVSREQVWRSIRTLVSGSGTSVLLTTQYLDEADRLADDVVVIDHGRVVASGTPSALKRKAGSARVRISLRDGSPARGRALELLAALEADGDRAIVVPAPDGLASLAGVIELLRPIEEEVEDVSLAHPSLDEVFTELTKPASMGLAVSSPEGA
jgi:ABC-2 type transport system ATP-binding protein